MSGPRPSGPGKAALEALLGDLISYYQEEARQGLLRVCRQAALTRRAWQFLDTGAPPELHLPESMEGCSQGDPSLAQHICPRLVQALEFLELISVNLLLFPWRKEIRSLKTFTGSFAYWVRPVLSKRTLDAILGKLGYMPTSETEFSLVQTISEEDTKQVVFDMFLVRVMCEAALGTAGGQAHGPHCRHSSARPTKMTQPGPGLETPQQAPSEGAGSERALAKGREEQSFLPVALSPREASMTSGRLLNSALASLDPPCRTSTCSDSEEFLSRYSDLTLRQTPLFLKDLPLGSLKEHWLQNPVLAACPSSDEVVTSSGSSLGVPIPSKLCLIPGPQLLGESLEPKPEAEPELATPGTDATAPNTSSEIDELCERLSHLFGCPALLGHPGSFPGPGAESGQAEPLVGPETAGEGGSPDDRVTPLWRSIQAPLHVREPPSIYYIPQRCQDHPRPPKTTTQEMAQGFNLEGRCIQAVLMESNNY